MLVTQELKFLHCFFPRYALLGTVVITAGAHVTQTRLLLPQLNKSFFLAGVKYLVLNVLASFITFRFDVSTSSHAALPLAGEERYVIAVIRLYDTL